MKGSSLICFALVALTLFLITGCASDVEVIKVRRVESPQGFTADSPPSPSVEDVPDEWLVSDTRLLNCLSYYERHDFDSCRIGVESYLSQNPAGWQGYCLLALLEYSAGDFEGAERCFQASLRFSPVNQKIRASIYLALGQALESQGETGLSKQHYVTALNLDPGLLAAREGIDRLTNLTSVGAQ
ncbi:MAG: hypothetical protein JSV52_13960 [Candidatus Zixiibacteriota bacterium]|nr:MAG: hypothetical protein JSV52_13960 [candidate division Zixibacteria bacterium]